MSRGKHTPGPWSVCGAQDGKCPCASVLYADGVICEVRDFNDDMADASGHAPSPAEAQANKHLIAAAPDLVETLRWVRANYASGATKEINARIDAALSKALADAVGE